MPDSNMNEKNSFDIVDPRWKGLYRIGGVAAIIAAALLLIEIIIFTIWPQQTTAISYFTLFQSNKLIGLLDFYILEIFAYILFVPIFLAIYVAIKKINESYMIIGLFFAFIGIAVFLSTNNPFSLLSLSDQYWSATTEAQKSVLLTAGQTIIANTGQRAVGGFNMGFLLVSIAGFIVSFVMLKGSIFTKSTAYTGILAFGISLVDYLRIMFIPSANILLLVIAVVSGILLLVWLFLVGRSFFKLSRSLSTIKN